jgi:aryl-alcohol dehydrogenase-like predicted oxidoreductase
MTFGDGRGLFKAIGTVGQAEADELVKTSIDGGINFFDTADNCTEGESEKILGQSLKHLSHRAEGCRDRDEGLERVDRREPFREATKPH